LNSWKEETTTETKTATPKDHKVRNTQHFKVIQNSTKIGTNTAAAATNKEDTKEEVADLLIITKVKISDPEAAMETTKLDLLPSSVTSLTQAAKCLRLDPSPWSQTSTT
jgi:hypothetical protein